MHHPLHIAIPTNGRPDLLQRTLESLAACQIPKCLVQTIVIENGGQNGAEEVVAAASPQLKASYRFVAEGNKSHALNVGLEGIEDGLILFFDDDIRLDRSVLEAYSTAADKFGEGHYFGGPFEVDCESEPPQWLKEFLPRSATGWKPPSDDYNISLSTNFYGFNWAMFARDLIATGPFNPQRGPSCNATGQEDEMQSRLRERGIVPRYVSDAKVWHYVPEDRCSIEWTINRTYRIATSLEMVKKRKPVSQLKCLWKSLSWRISPKWVIRRAIARFASDDQARFKAAYKIARQRAVIDMLKT